MKKTCGLDVHKSMILMCILKENGEKIILEFSSLTGSIESMRDLMKEHGVQEVGMESTGLFWIPVWRILQGHFELKLINPYFIRQLPGRKTDVKDSEWIAHINIYSACPDKFIVKPSEELGMLGHARIPF